MKQHISGRIARLQAVMQEKQLDAALIYDRENLIYFAGVDDLEGGVLCVPATGEATVFCLAWDGPYMRQTSGVAQVVPYPFPQESQSLRAARWLKELNITAPRVGFTRYFISLKDYQCLQAAVPDFVVEDIALACYQLRAVKCEEELALIREAARFLDAGMEAAVQSARPGMLETELLAEAEYAMRKAGSQGASFRMQVLCHKRQMLMHPYAGPYALGENEPVVIHLGSSYQGYVAKMCRTVFLGEAPQESRDIYRCLREAQQVAMENLRPGVTCREVFDAVKRYTDTTPFAPYWVMEHIGYGVGIRQSEFWPIIAAGNETRLEENMVVDVLLPTFLKPGVGGPRITDTIHITAHGAEYLTSYRRDEITKAFTKEQVH